MSRRTSMDFHFSLTREIDLEVCLKTLKIHQRMDSEVMYAGWDASMVLTKYLEMLCHKKSDFFVGKKVLEIGSRLGLCGLTAATLGAQATLTESTDVLPIIRHNINENKQNLVCYGGYAIAEPLTLGDITSELLQKDIFDYVFVVGAVCFEEALDPLITTLLHLNDSTTQKPEIFLSQELAESEMLKNLWTSFMSKLKRHFQVDQVPEEDQHPNYRSSKVCLLRIVRIKS